MDSAKEFARSMCEFFHYSAETGYMEVDEEQMAKQVTAHDTQVVRAAAEEMREKVEELVGRMLQEAGDGEDGPDNVDIGNAIRALPLPAAEAAPRTEPIKLCYFLGRETIEKVAELGALDTERVSFVAADELFHQNPYKGHSKIVSCVCGQALLDYMEKCHMCGRVLASIKAGK